MSRVTFCQAVAATASAHGEIRTRTANVLNVVPLPVGVRARAGAEPGDRTQHCLLVEQITSPAVSLRVGHPGVEPDLSAYQANKVYQTVMPSPH